MKDSTKPFSSRLRDFAPLQVVFHGLNGVFVIVTHVKGGCSFQLQIFNTCCCVWFQNVLEVEWIYSSFYPWNSCQENSCNTDTEAFESATSRDPNRLMKIWYLSGAPLSVLTPGVSQKSSKRKELTQSYLLSTTKTWLVNGKSPTVSFAVTVIHVFLCNVVPLGREIVNRERWCSQQKTSAESTKGQVKHANSGAMTCQCLIKQRLFFYVFFLLL